MLSNVCAEHYNWYYRHSWSIPCLLKAILSVQITRGHLNIAFFYSSTVIKWWIWQYFHSKLTLQERLSSSATLPKKSLISAEPMDRGTRSRRDVIWLTARGGQTALYKQARCPFWFFPDHFEHRDLRTHLFVLPRREALKGLMRYPTQNVFEACW